MSRLRQTARLWLQQRWSRSAAGLIRPEIHRSGFGGVLLVPSAAYHVAELKPLADELEERGTHVSIMITRAAPQAVAGALDGWTGPLYAWPRVFSLLPSFQAVVVVNDWGPTRQLVELARRRAAPTFAKVEGVQDFADLDTGRTRQPYRHVDVVLGQGENDRIALGDVDTHVVGSSRLESIARDPPRSTWSRHPVVVVNSNFTYGVLTNVRMTWLESVLDACEHAGVKPIISQHPAEDPLPSRLPVSEISVKDLLENSADVLVSRFSTVPFEAMARGIPFVYYNPHGEEVPTFREPRGAFRISDSVPALETAIREALTWRGRYRERSASFFSRQVDIDPEFASSVRGAEVILSFLGSNDEGPQPLS